MPGGPPTQPQPPQGPVDPGYGYPIRPVDPGYGVPIRPVYPSHPIWRPDLGIWGGPYFPPVIWPGPKPPYVDIGFPMPQPPRPPQGPVDPGYGYPERPVDPGYGYPEKPVDPGYGIPEVRPPKPPGLPGQLPTQDPEGSGWVWCYVPGYGWMWARVPQRPTPPPDGGNGGTTPPPTDPEAIRPAHPIQPTVPEPKDKE